MNPVKLRISGDLHGIAAALLALHAAAPAHGFTVARKSGLYRNRRPGFRVYVTLLFPGPGARPATTPEGGDPA